MYGTRFHRWSAVCGACCLLNHMQWPNVLQLVWCKNTRNGPVYQKGCVRNPIPPMVRRVGLLPFKSYLVAKRPPVSWCKNTHTGPTYEEGCVRNPIPLMVRRVWGLLLVKSYAVAKRPPAGVMQKHSHWPGLQEGCTEPDSTDGPPCGLVAF
ncbi:hypothetical protein AVEN_158259-1 [Araneus ventricosus]|uniref:Uncharacterized protein n=1 Tax=Araneus ventricosus TaxID=182803 RepID=A0A4Y2G1L0_ARAVE|nr:hypothetical protein AVEN_158259-1 [Araneus ventricosus]